MPDEIVNKHVKVVVLGDIGRSPRMQYHALSLASHGFKATIIGYLESTPLPEILDHPNITISKLHPLLLSRGPQLFQYALKAFWQAISLFVTLCISGNCHYLLTQNPPAIPTLPICKFYCLVTRTKFIIDWHNYAYSIMSLSLPPSHPLLWISTQIEKWFGKSSDHNFCVTYAMKEDLLKNCMIDATVLYDRAPHIFHPITLEEKHDWFRKLGQQYREFRTEHIRSQAEGDDKNTTATAFTEVVQNVVRWKENRPGLLFSSTSWTPDEDFGILMAALQTYETTSKLTQKLPNLICVITGKGPMKQHYIDLIATKNWEHVKVITPWLEAADYPRMVASADLGVCLHTSSSGLDLPMKVVDMFGAGLPVCAYDFNCLNELVDNAKNGYTFKESGELAKLIIKWFEDFPNNKLQNQIERNMRKELETFQMLRWENNWDLRAQKVFDI